MRRGSGVIYIDGEFSAVAAGDTIHIPRGAAHAAVPDENTELELICFFPHPDLSENNEETDIDVMEEMDGG